MTIGCGRYLSLAFSARQSEHAHCGEPSPNNRCISCTRRARRVEAEPSGQRTFQLSRALSLGMKPRSTSKNYVN